MGSPLFERSPVSQAVPLAKAAREKLAAALNALQSDDAPEALLEVAEPIAQAMSVLHRVERSQGADLEGRDRALDAVRRALDMLQKIEQTSPAVDLCLEAVASSLAKVHGLAKIAAAPAAAPVPAPAPQPPPASFSAPLPPAPAPAHLPAAPRPAAPAPAAAWPPAAALPGAPSPALAAAPAAPATQVIAGATIPQAPAPAPTEAFPPPAPRMQGGTLMMSPAQGQEVKAQATAHAAAAAVPGPAPFSAQQPAQPFGQAYAPAPQPVGQAYASAPQPAPQPVVAQAYQPAPVAAAPPRAQPAAPEPARPATPAPAGSVVVELGAHSVSNFYKGLSGNDVIEHGGIFVGTYKIPKIGTSVSLRVLLPGDYEFHAAGSVQWVREAGDGVEPGFGAKFTQITPEGRQLVYRYARNREPIFYDDL